MNDPHIAIYAALSAPFDADEVRSRNQGGRDLQYITARAAMNRLDDVLGPTNWWDEYTPLGVDAVICKLTIRLPDGSTLTKSDAGGFSKTNDPSDIAKSGMSDAFKRAAVKFGVGRYLYGEGVSATVRAELLRQRKAAKAEAAKAEAAEALPREPGCDDDRDEPAPQYQQAQRQHQSHQPPAGPSNGRPHGNGNGSLPRSGKALFAWAKEQGEKHGVDVIGVINEWGKFKNLPARMIQWEDGAVAEAVQQGIAFLAHNGALEESAR